MRKSKLIFCLLFVISINSCSFLKNKRLLKMGSFEQESFKTELPFKLIHGWIIVEAEIENKNYNFVFDTGAEVSVITPNLIPVLGINKKSSIKVTDSNKDSDRINLYVLESIKMNNISFSKLLCIEKDLNHVIKYLKGFKCGVKLHGIIGNNLMRKATWKIDYKNKIITFWDNDRNMIQSKNSSIVPLEISHSGNAKINVKIEDKNKPFTFDTGYGGFIKADLSFTKELFDQENKPEKYAKGVVTSVGINGTQTANLLKQKIPNIFIGEKNIKNKMISFEEKSAYLIGNKFWENFTLTIDWKNSLLYLETINEDKLDFLKAFQYGISTDITNKTLSIQNYWTSHSLYKPIHHNNTIVSIENIQISSITDFCEFLKTSLPELLKKDKLQIEVVENGELKKIQLEKELLIE